MEDIDECLMNLSLVAAALCVRGIQTMSLSNTEESNTLQLRDGRCKYQLNAMTACRAHRAAYAVKCNEVI